MGNRLSSRFACIFLAVAVDVGVSGCGGSVADAKGILAREMLHI